MTQQLHVTKLDAARRQAETAIVLYFHYGDPVSIHTLAAAAYDIVRDVSAKRGASPMFVKDQVLDFVRPEMAAEFKARINEAQNFFKHGDKDPDGVVHFGSAQAEHLLFDVCGKYRELTGEYPPIVELFATWFMRHHQNWFNLPPEVKTEIVHSQERWRGNRQGYFSAMLPLLTTKGAGGV